VITYPVGVGALQTRVLDTGTGGPEILLVHGAASRAERWVPAMEVMAGRGWHCFSMDQVGHGFASKPADFVYSAEALARFVLGTADALGLRKPVLIGTSLGGLVAATAALMAPDRFAALGMVGALGLAPIGPERGAQIAKIVANTDRTWIAQKVAMASGGAAVSEDDPRVVEEWRVNSGPGGQEAMDAVGRYIRDVSDRELVVDRLAKEWPREKLLLVWGGADPVVPVACGKAGAERLGVPLNLVDGAGHTPYAEQPEAFVKIVEAFLKRLGIV
jgi:pyruvate dehydrogenase E2 component (dihydrolipoamide acetyltransferase)